MLQFSSVAPVAEHKAVKKSAAKPPTTRPEMVQPSVPQQPHEPESGEAGELSVTGEDFTMIPGLLDRKLEKYDTDSALRSTILKPGPNWKRTRQANLLTLPKTATIDSEAVSSEWMPLVGVERSPLHVLKSMS
jgi:hypothetical protein